MVLMIRSGMILVMPFVLLVKLVMPCLLGAGDMFQYDIRGALCTG